MKRGKKSSAKSRAARGANSSRRPLLLTGIFLVIAAVLVLRFLKPATPPPPPEVPLAQLDPVLRQTIETSRVAVVSAPRSSAAWGRLGEALHAAQFNPEARVCYSNAAALDAGNFRWPYLGGVLEQQGDPAEAVRLLTRATELAGAHDSPRYQLARTLVEQGRFDQAEPLLRQLLAARPDHAGARVELARVHLARGAFKDATLALQPAMTNPFTMRPATLLAAQIAQRNQQPEVAAQLSRAANNLPRGYDWPDPVLRQVQAQRTDRARLAEQANTLLQQQQFTEARILLDRLLAAAPDDPEGLLLLGRWHYLQKRCAEAEEVYRRYLQKQPDSLNGLTQLGLALMCREHWSNAVSVLERAVTLKPDFAQGHNNLGLARARAGDAPGAIRAYRDALRSSPGDVNLLLNLAEELANADHLAEAREHVARAATLSPRDPRVLQAKQQLEMK